VESRTGAVAVVSRWHSKALLSQGAPQSGFGMALFPAPAHRTGQARLAHPALGERFTISPTEANCPSSEFDEAQYLMQGGNGKLLGCLPSQFVLGAQPLSQPLASMSFYSSIGMTDWPQTKVIRPPSHHSIECRDYSLLG